jgi:CHASE2 domain-containing sensor protein
MEAIRKYVAAGPSFVILYLLLMFPTYVLPYFGSNSAVVNAGLAAADAAAGGGNGLNILMFAHLACLGGMVLITWLRGAVVGKGWLVIFPILASVFDMVPGLNWIPLVPTAMHLAAIIVGVSSQQVSE